jgi:hypothetical protein
MRFWISVPFVRRTRIGFSVSDREIARAFAKKPPPTAEEIAQRALEEAVRDAWAKATADKYAPLIVDVIIWAVVSAIVLTVWWAL